METEAYTLQCKKCGKTVERMSNSQRYCFECSPNKSKWKVYASNEKYVYCERCGKKIRRKSGHHKYCKSCSPDIHGVKKQHIKCRRCGKIRHISLFDLEENKSRSTVCKPCMNKRRKEEIVEVKANKREYRLRWRFYITRPHASPYRKNASMLPYHRFFRWKNSEWLFRTIIADKEHDGHISRLMAIDMLDKTKQIEKAFSNKNKQRETSKEIMLMFGMM